MPDFVNESLVAHELAHQWFGDLLTCREWSDGWLNEGFATYFEAIWKQYIDGEDEFRYALHEKAQLYLAEDRGRYRRPIVTRTYNEPIDIFDMHLYPKGALVLHMLRYQLGDNDWWRAINHYVVKHRESTVVTGDLQRAIQEATGRNFDKFFDQFVFTGGHPEFDVSYSWDDTTRTAKLNVKQVQQLDALTPLFDLPVIVYFQSKQHNYECQIRVNAAEQTFGFVLEERPELVRFDRHGDILKTLTFGRSVEMLIYQLERDSTVAGQIEAAHELGKLASRKAVDALIAALQRDAFWGVRVEVAKALGEARTQTAKNALLTGLAIEHSRVRRAVVDALGQWKRDQVVADELWRRFEAGDTSYFVEAEIGKALGRLKVGTSFERSVAALDRHSWNDIVQMYALTGLGALRDVAGVAVAVEWSHYGRGLWARIGAITALGDLGQLDVARLGVVEHLSDLLTDSSLRVREASARALAKIGDTRALPALERTIARDADGRVVRLAREAMQAIKSGARQSEELASLRADVDALKEQNRELRERLDVVEGRAASKQ
jgi:aminopeptidase N